MGTLVLGVLSSDMWTALFSLLQSRVFTFMVSPTWLLLFLFVLAILRRRGNDTFLRLTAPMSRCIACITTIAPSVPTETIMLANPLVM